MTPRQCVFRTLLLAVVAALLLPASGMAQRRGRSNQRGGNQTAARNRSQYAASIRRPRGIYAVVVVNESGGRRDSEDLDALIGNPAVSGLAIRMFWSSLQPAKNRYDFSKLDAVFASAAAKHKTIQLILLPGFGTPAWVLDELPSCDGVGSPRGADSSRCGRASFEVSEGRAHGQKKELPLPWNPVYKNYWKAFLTEVAARYGSREEFVSIAVTGPTAQSAEIILPRAGDQLERWSQLLERAYRDASYHRSDKAFVEEWDAAVTMFGQVFRNVTIVLTRGSGLLDFTRGQARTAEAAIVSAFAHQAVGPNAKATQTSGMKACRSTVAGIRGVKEMSGDASLSPPVLGGAQFDTSFSEKPATEGCPASCNAETPACRSVTPTEALSNVLSVYFDGTPAGQFYRASNGAAPLNYLQVYARDIEFANTQPAVQTILEQASQQLVKLAR